MNEKQKRIYATADGRWLLAHPGIGGNVFFSATVSRTGAARRYKSPDLPLRNSIYEAQADLDNYAKKKGFKLVREEEFKPYEVALGRD